MMRYAAPEGTHDDCVIALALAWQGLGLWEVQRAQRVIPLQEIIEISPI